MSLLLRASIAPLSLFLSAPLLIAFPCSAQEQAGDGRVLRGLGAPATSIALSFDGSQVVCSSANGYIQTWMPAENRFRSIYFPGIGNTRLDINTAPDLVVDSKHDRVLGVNVPASNIGSNSDSLFKWRLSTRRIDWGYSQHDSRFAVDASGRPVARWYWFSSDAQILDTQRPQRIPKSQVTNHSSFDSNYFARHLLQRTLIHSPSSLRGVAFTHKGKEFITVDNTQLQFWNARTGQLLHSSSMLPDFLRSPGTLARLYPSPNGRFVAVVLTGTARPSFSGFGFGFTPSRQSAQGTDDMPHSPLTIGLWDEQTQKWSSTQVEGFQSFSSTPPPAMISLAWMPDSRSFWTGGVKITRFRSEDLMVLRDMRISGPVAVSGDGKILATRNIVRGQEANGLILWHIPNDK